MRYDVIPWGEPRHANVLATPLLIQQGTAPGHPLFGPQVEAYCEMTLDDGREVWRVRDDKYDPPGTEYVKVRVEVVEEADPFARFAKEVQR